MHPRLPQQKKKEKSIKLLHLHRPHGTIDNALNILHVADETTSRNRSIHAMHDHTTRHRICSLSHSLPSCSSSPLLSRLEQVRLEPTIEADMIWVT